VLLLGLDAASDFGKFGYALGHFDGGRVTIREAGLVKTRDQPNALLSIAAPELRSASSALVGIDAPLGWPAAMGAELQHHRAGDAFRETKDAMFHRETDRLVRERIAKKPLEVGADKIARAAHSALAALGMLREASGKPLPLAWSHDFSEPSAIEVYPAGTLKARGLAHSGYKEPSQLHVRRDIATRLSDELVGLEPYIDGSADVFDACLCLAAAKDFLEGRAEPPRNMELAKREGWIWIRAIQY
jgi:hypothetical protein